MGAGRKNSGPTKQADACHAWPTYTFLSQGALGSAQEGRWRADPQAHISFDPRQSHV